MSTVNFEGNDVSSEGVSVYETRGAWKQLHEGPDGELTGMTSGVTRGGDGQFREMDGDTRRWRVGV